MTPVSLT